MSEDIVKALLFASYLALAVTIVILSGPAWPVVMFAAGLIGAVLAKVLLED